MALYHRDPASAYLHSWPASKASSITQKSMSSRSSHSSSINDKLYLTPIITNIGAEPLFKESYLSSEEDLSPSEGSEDSFSIAESEPSANVRRRPPSLPASQPLPEKLADRCPGTENNVARVVSFASAGRAKMVSVQGPPPLTAAPQFLRPHTSHGPTPVPRHGLSPSPSWASKSSSIYSSARLSRSASTYSSSVSAASLYSCSTLPAVNTAPPSFLDHDPFATASIKPSSAPKRSHSRLRSLSQSFSKSVLNLHLEPDPDEPQRPSSKKEKRQSLQMTGRAATERETPKQIPLHPVVSDGAVCRLDKRDSKLKKPQKRRSIFGIKF